MSTSGSIPAELAFDETGPFYPMMTAFIVAISGLPSIFEPSNPMGFTSDQAVFVEGKVHKELNYRLLSVHQMATGGKFSSIGITTSLTQMLVNTAYESVKGQNDNSLEFEFFRHIRNACSHGNRFNFFAHQPGRPAAWRTKTINHTLKGMHNPLHGAACWGNYLASADAILLLWDIEQKLAGK